MSDLWQELDLNRDAVVEASAGTGKTYTIEHLVGRLLLERKMTIDQILLVTFTEKATGEMKERIRCYLTALLHAEGDALSDEARTHLARELERFDEAAITTIHGFCQRVLTEFSFENGQVGRQELGDTKVLSRRLLREIMRIDWPDWAEAQGVSVESMLRQQGEKATPRNIHDHVLELIGKWRHDSDCFLEAWSPEQGQTDRSLVARTAETLYQRLEEEKATRAIFTFDDMISRVARAVTRDEDTGGELVHILRSRYRVALVDEFQDTDPQQWTIFQKLFHESPDHTLIVVGDPKQAIYRFRGADLNTYLSARDKVDHTATLDTNFRSTAPLMDSFNHLFSHTNWFGTGKIAYDAVKAGSQAKLQLVSDVAYGGAPVVAVELSESSDSTAPPAVARMAEFAAREIAACLADPQRLQPARDEQAALCEDDFCILVRTRVDASHYENALRKRGIAYSFYKKGGVYQSDEALHLQRVLAMLVQPESESVRALGEATRFFTLDISSDSHAHAKPQELRAQLERWLALAEQRAWSQLFRGLLYESGLLYREAQAVDGERRLANYLQITEELEEAALQQGLDSKGIYDLLTQQLQQQVEVDEEADRHRLETDRPAVKIMTMHVSKGLQFPVVFIGSKSKSKNSPGAVFTFSEGGERTISIDPDHKAQALEEELEEQKRLFYVAMTRAEFRLFLPYGGYESGKSDKRRFNAIDKLTHPVLTDTMAAAPTCVISVHHTALPDTILTGRREALTAQAPAAGRAGQTALNIPAPTLSRRQRQVDSFTKLSRHRAHALDDSERLQEKGADELEVQPLRRTHLPPGIRSGNAFHDAMEALCGDQALGGFACVRQWDTPGDALGDDRFASVIDTCLESNGLPVLPPPGLALEGYTYRSAREEMSRMVWDALKAPLQSVDGQSFTLSDLAPADCRAEMEFYATEAAEMLGDDPLVDEARRGLLNGFIDLLFEYDQRLYILDWKTNTLEDYSAAGLTQAMHDADYMLQYRIYGLAVMRWLEQRGKDPATLGGAYYLFSRGLEHPETHGIYMDVDHDNRREEWRMAVSERLRPHATNPGGAA